MEELFKENAKLLYAYLCSLCHDESLAEELTQETFYKACLSIDRYDESCKFSTWLCQIGKHTYYQFTQKNNLSSTLHITNWRLFTDIGLCTPTNRIFRKCPHLILHSAIWNRNGWGDFGCGNLYVCNSKENILKCKFVGIIKYPWFLQNHGYYSLISGGTNEFLWSS